MNTSKKSNGIFSYESILFYFSLVMLIAVVGGFFYFNYMLQKTDEEIKTLDETLAKQKTKEQKALEDEVLSNKQRLQDFPLLLESHKVVTEFFRRLEGRTHPKVVFDLVKISPVEGSVDLSGKADSFESLGQQLIIFKTSPEIIQKVELSKINLNNEGKVDFAFALVINPKITSFVSSE